MRFSSARLRSRLSPGRVLAHPVCPFRFPSDTLRINLALPRPPCPALSCDASPRPPRFALLHTALPALRRLAFASSPLVGRSFPPLSACPPALSPAPIKSYEGGFGQRPGQEAQGGTTFCAVVARGLFGSALALAQEVGEKGGAREVSDSTGGWGGAMATTTTNTDDSSPSPSASQTKPDNRPPFVQRPTTASKAKAKADQDNRAISWLLHRQISLVLPSLLPPPPSSSSLLKEEEEEEAAGVRGGGFQGRPGKKGDACYSFWCGGALEVRLLSRPPSVRFSLPPYLERARAFDTTAMGLPSRLISPRDAGRSLARAFSSYSDGRTSSPRSLRIFADPLSSSARATLPPPHLAPSLSC